MERNETRNWKIYNASIRCSLVRGTSRDFCPLEARRSLGREHIRLLFVYICTKRIWHNKRRTERRNRAKSETIVRSRGSSSIQRPMHASYSVVGTLISRGTWATQSFLLVNGALFFELHVASTRWSRSKQLSVEAICVSVSEFIVPECKIDKRVRKDEWRRDTAEKSKRWIDPFATIYLWNFNVLTIFWYTDPSNFRRLSVAYWIVLCIELTSFYIILGFGQIWSNSKVLVDVYHHKILVSYEVFSTN